MRKLLKVIGLFSIIFFLASSLNAQDLGSFGSSKTKKVGPKTIAVPYTDVVSYLGYAAKDTEDEVKDGKKFYYLYIWIPAVTSEIGIRMMSPAGDSKEKNAIESQDYLDNQGSDAYFDTYITFEKSNILSKSNISEEGVANAEWHVLAKNDDSGEMPKNPGGKSYNSLLRYESKVGDPLDALTVGLYRVGFTTFKTGEVNGTFIAQVGSPIKLPGVGVAKTIEDLLKQINE